MGVGQADVARGRAMAGRLTMAVLGRAWQMLLRGLEELRLAPHPLLAAEMLLVRLAYVADLPPPAELARAAAGGAAPAGGEREPALSRARDATPALAEPAPSRTPDATPALAEPAPVEAAPIAPAAPADFSEAVELFRRHGEPMLHGWLYGGAHLVQFEPGRIELRLAPGAPPDLAKRAADLLGRWTARPWSIGVVSEPERGAPSLAEQAAADKRARIDILAADPRVRPVLESFPGARIVDVRPAADGAGATFHETTVERP
jgi:DNA polymerase-3 subunit gamma/tau